MPQVKQNMTGQAYWRSLEEYADSPQFRELLGYAGTAVDEQQSAGDLSRRRFLQLMGASMSLAGLTLAGCRRWPEEQLAPYASRPEGHTPGMPTYYATMVERGGAALGILAESYDGRPIKLEGNPKHPCSKGATDPWTQASILTLYDPDRSRSVLEGKGDSRKRAAWANFQSFADQHFADLAGSKSASLAVLAQPSDSPSLAAQKAAFLKKFPQAKWYEWEPINRDNSLAGSRLAFGQTLRPQYQLDKAEVIACFDADPLFAHPASLKHARDWARGRKPEQGKMSRLYVAEPTFTTTGSVADERLPARASAIPSLLQAVAVRLGVIGGEAGSLNGSTQWVESLVSDLQASAGKSLIIVGEGQAPEVHALAWAINDKLAALGKTVTLTQEPNQRDQTQAEQLAELVQRISANKVTSLVILGGNPAYDAPADLDFAAALDRVPNSIHLGLYANETSQLCNWHLPQAHELESWGDGRAWDGTVSVRQPLILPLYDGKSDLELLALLQGNKAAGLDIVRSTITPLLSGDHEKAWRQVLHTGILAGSYKTANAAAKPAQAIASEKAGEYEVVFQLDASMYDGRWANNGWLQELPSQITKLTWDNAALMAVADFRKLGLKIGDVVKVTANGKELALPAIAVPGQVAGSIVVHLGYGRTSAGHVGNGVGKNTYQLRTTAGMHVASATLAATGEHELLAVTAEHDLIDPVGEAAVRERAGAKHKSGTLIKEATLAAYLANPSVVHEGSHGSGIALQLFDPPLESPAKRPGGPTAFNDPHAWGMAIDMSSCIGCNACVVACQAENNIPVVGKEEVARSRELHWIRIDRYFKGDPEQNPSVVHQPVMCVHCENAPCEQVCPVNASVHDSEGLNLQVYNRCIGTRYCSNNCPYKVRRFNFFDYHAKDPRGAAKPWLNIPDMQQQSEIDLIKRMVFNPDVTVRMRGVMEKCTYCVQRIKAATITAKNEFARGERTKPTINDGEVVTACQQSCPTEAIVFGDLNDPNSRVTKMQQSNRTYKLLNELNTRPRGQHLAKISNPKEVAGS